MALAPPSTSRFFEFASGLPDQLLLGAEAAGKLRALPQAAQLDNIAILGMGTGRTSGLVVRALGANVIPVPILVESSYEIPAAIADRSLVFAVSGTGDTDEVNHAAAAAAALGARLVVVTTGGWLADFAQDHGASLLRIPPDVPARASLGFVVGAVLTTLQNIGFLPEAGRWIEGADAQLRRRREELARQNNIAETLASLLVGRHVLCQGDALLGAAAAERWKAQINQNAKQAASASEQPNASHNEAVAWDCQSERTSLSEAAVQLRHGYEDPRVSRRMDLLAQYLRGKIPVHTVRGEGDSRFAALMDLVMIGDFTSLHLAVKNGAEPGDVRFISQTVKKGFVPPAR
jgi:glucose/mannose-6-phosphate isomerase